VSFVAIQNFTARKAHFFISNQNNTKAPKLMARTRARREDAGKQRPRQSSRRRSKRKGKPERNTKRRKLGRRKPKQQYTYLSLMEIVIETLEERPEPRIEIEALVITKLLEGVESYLKTQFGIWVLDRCAEEVNDSALQVNRTKCEMIKKEEDEEVQFLYVVPAPIIFTIWKTGRCVGRIIDC
jgi:hypothetical protein